MGYIKFLHDADDDLRHNDNDDDDGNNHNSLTFSSKQTKLKMPCRNTFITFHTLTFNTVVLLKAVSWGFFIS